MADCRGPEQGGAQRRCRGLDAGWIAFALRWLEEEEDPARGAGPEEPPGQAAHEAHARPVAPNLMPGRRRCPSRRGCRRAAISPRRT